MIAIEITPGVFQAECNRLTTALLPFHNELAELADLDAKARKDADIQEVRRIKQRVADLHELIVSTAAEGKKELHQFIQAFEDATEERKRSANEEIARRTAVKEKFRQEAEQKLEHLDNEIKNAEDERQVIWSQHGLIIDLHVRTETELSNQINSSLDAA